MACSGRGCRCGLERFWRQNRAADLWAGLVARNPKVWLVEQLAESMSIYGMSNLASSASGASVPLAT